MAVPKSKVSKARRDKRRSSTWKLDQPNMVKCPKCGELFERKPMSFACPKCGTDGEPTEIGKEFYIDTIECE